MDAGLEPRRRREKKRGPPDIKRAFGDLGIARMRVALVTGGPAQLLRFRETFEVLEKAVAGNASNQLWLGSLSEERKGTAPPFDRRLSRHRGLKGGCFNPAKGSPEPALVRA